MPFETYQQQIDSVSLIEHDFIAAPDEPAYCLVCQGPRPMHSDQAVSNDVLGYRMGIFLCNGTSIELRDTILLAFHIGPIVEAQTSWDERDRRQFLAGVANALEDQVVLHWDSSYGTSPTYRLSKSE